MCSLKSCLTAVLFVTCVWREELVFSSAEELDIRIVGGDEVSIQDFPFQVALEGGNVFLCGATIISPNWALTAAHCVYRKSRTVFYGSTPYNVPKTSTRPLRPPVPWWNSECSESLHLRHKAQKKFNRRPTCEKLKRVPTPWLRLRSGSSLFLKGGTIHKVSKVVWHSLYDDVYKDYDVAVILVSEPFQLTPYVQPIPLATGPAVPGQEVTVAGWGFLEQAQIHRPKQLMAVSVTVMDWNLCRQTYRFLTARQMCAGSINKDSCYGDSGGPLVSDGKQVGIVSVGYRCAYRGQPGIYTNISVVGPWIERVTQMNADYSDSIVFPPDAE